jgi:predicted dehydrogenase
MKRSKNIRVGLIRCDTHGLWFGPLMAEHDARVLYWPMDPGLPHSHSWQRGGCHRFFYTNYGDPLLMTAPYVGGFEFVKVWDEERHVAEQASRVFFGKPKVCDTFEECSDDVDLVFIASCNFDGTDHLRLATPGLKKGVATFVDKPFADTVADARKILSLAKKHNAPVYSQSIVRVEPVLTQFKNRIPEVGEVGFATLAGYKTHPAGLMHTVSAIQHLFGPGIQTVRVLEAPNQISIFFDYGGKPGTPGHGIMLNTDPGPRDGGQLRISIMGSQSEIHALIPGERQYIDGTAVIIRSIKQLVKTRKTPLDALQQVVEVVAVIEAFRKAKKTGKPVRVAEFLRGK